MIKLLFSLFTDLYKFCVAFVGFMAHHFLLFILIIGLFALLFWVIGRGSDKFHANHAYKKRQKREAKLAIKAQKQYNDRAVNIIMEIFMLIDNRMPADPNPQELRQFREWFEQLRQELLSGDAFTYGPDQLLQQYYIDYPSDKSSQLVLKIQELCNILGYRVY